jgi:hypothetical protein
METVHRYTIFEESHLTMILSSPNEVVIDASIDPLIFGDRWWIKS